MPLSTNDVPRLTDVGGKAASLVRLRQGGFRVPDGVVLTTGFFAPWVAQVEESAPWRAVVAELNGAATRLPGLEERARLADACEQIKRTAGHLPLDGAQQAVLDEVTGESMNAIYAVRSSSPEEDLAGASFAGLYETVLGVRADAFLSAVRECFLSCLDARVLLYKREMNFASLSPAIAVVIQEQVASEIAGVAFSLNPLTNDFDEALINASWGLGEALVAGDITPDKVVVDKVTRAVIENRPGEKGGDRSDESCLDETQIAELVDTLRAIETHYGEPVDVEWAIAGGELHVLQARPITAYVPMAPALQTQPGEPRHLYMDGALTDGLTISGPISPITLDTYEWIYRLMLHYVVGTPPEEIDLVEAGTPFGGSRLYVNLSHFLHLIGKGEFIAGQADSTNALVAEILRATDLDRYRPASPPRIYRVSTLLLHTPRILWRMREVLKWGFKPLRRERFKEDYAAALDYYDEWIRHPIDQAELLSKSFNDWCAQLARTTSDSTGPALMYFIYGGIEKVKRLVDRGDPEQAALADALRRGYPDDQVVQMGLVMFDLSQILAKDEFRDLDRLLGNITHRVAPAEFLALWDEFIDRYGCRGPLEMELENPGYAEAPLQALSQIATIALSGQGFNPHEMQRTLIGQREAAFEKLMTLVPRRKRKGLARAYDNILSFSHCRELIKHHLMQVNEKLRQRLLYLAERFISAGRLDGVAQIFELTMAEIDRGMTDPDFDLRAAAEVNGAPYRKLKAQLRHFPMMIDSRGRILRPESSDADGALTGAGVSPGVVQGTVKVLNDPFEKEVLPGDVLVAVTTDPGWTPLFINASAVLLEIGGELQHGALVAREYGKPCVAGIADVTSRLSDGQLIEVDGNAGTVQVLEPPE